MWPGVKKLLFTGSDLKKKLKRISDFITPLFGFFRDYRDVNIWILTQRYLTSPFRLFGCARPEPVFHLRVCLLSHLCRFIVFRRYLPSTLLSLVSIQDLPDGLAFPLVSGSEPRIIIHDGTQTWLVHLFFTFFLKPFMHPYKTYIDEIV